MDESTPVPGRDGIEEVLFGAILDEDGIGESAYEFIEELYPICRSITGNGLRATLAAISGRIKLTTSEIASGTPVFDWTVPKEWNVAEAYIRDASGTKVVDFHSNNLHLVNYSCPVRTRMTLAELRPYLHVLPEHPNWIPYRTSYYRETWGFCLSKQQMDSLQEGSYEVVIDSTLEDGALTYGECTLPGSTNEEVLIFTHCCHPSTCNDNLTGIALATLLAEYLAQRRHRFTYRFVFAPATIGSISWLAKNEDNLDRISFGLVLGLLGDSAPFTYKKSRRSNTNLDRVATYVLRQWYPDTRVSDFSPYGYDERQFCSPGFDLPVGRITRSSNGEYAEYHTSADNLDFISSAALGESFVAILKVLAVMETCRCYVNLQPKCEPRLGKYGLYRPVGGKGPDSSEYSMLWVLNQSDGTRDLLDIAVRAGISYENILRAAYSLEQAGLLAPAKP